MKVFDKVLSNVFDKVQIGNVEEERQKAIFFIERLQKVKMKGLRKVAIKQLDLEDIKRRLEQNPIDEEFLKYIKILSKSFGGF